jgi:hypothetical protein
MDNNARNLRDTFDMIDMILDNVEKEINGNNIIEPRKVLNYKDLFALILNRIDNIKKRINPLSTDLLVKHLGMDREIVERVKEQIKEED